MKGYNRWKVSLKDYAAHEYYETKYLFISTQKKKAGSVRLSLNTVRVNIGTLKP